jgi:hypothetical protein
MRDMQVDGRLQATAAVALLETSRLVCWDVGTSSFVPTTRDRFEEVSRLEVHPVFGRVICWITFSAGAELLAKGVCLARGIEIRREQNVPTYPNSALGTWAHAFVRDPGYGGSVRAPNYGSLGNLTYKKHGEPSVLERLCTIIHASSDQRAHLVAAYTLLSRSIRNRDAHAYVPNVRDQHFSLVPDLFAKVFNDLVGWLEGGPSVITIWRSEAQQFIDAL